MKHSFTSTLLPVLNRTEILDLSYQVRETLVPVSDKPVKKFTSADLWNIRNQKRTFTRRLHLTIY